MLDPDPDPYSFFLDPDPYQSSPWIRIRIRNKFFHILDQDPDPYQNDTDPQHCVGEMEMKLHSKNASYTVMSSKDVPKKVTKLCHFGDTLAHL